MGPAGLYKSTDGGNSWSIRLSGRCDEVRFTPSGDTVFISGNGTGFRRSTDGGNSFSTFSSGWTLGERNHFDYCFNNPAYMYGASYSSSSFRVYKSTDHGVTFSQVSPSAPSARESTGTFRQPRNWTPSASTGSNFSNA